MRLDNGNTERQGLRKRNIRGVEFVWLKGFPYQENNWRRIVDMLNYSLRVIPAGLRSGPAPDVILASSPHQFAGLAGWLLAKLRKARFVLEIRDLWPLTLVEIGNYGRHSLAVRLLGVLEKLLYARAEKIVVLLPRASDYLTRLGVPEAKIVHIPNGVSPELFSHTDVELPDKLGGLISELKARDKLVVGYAGAHGVANALDVVIEAARLLQESGLDRVHFLLVGGGPEKERLVERVQALALSNLSFYKPVPKKAISRLLEAFDVAVISMKDSNLYKYGVSLNKLYDYLACGRPVIWAADSANDPVAEARCGITVPPEDPAAMAEAIDRISSLSDEERRNMGLKGYEYVMKYHSVPSLAGKLLKVLEQVSHGRGG